MSKILFASLLIVALLLGTLLSFDVAEAYHHQQQRFSSEVLQSFINRHNKIKQSYTHHLKHNGQKLEEGFWRNNNNNIHQQQHYHEINDNNQLASPVPSNVVGAWLGINAGFFQVANPLINDLLKYELTNFTYPEYNTSELGIHIYLNNITVTDFDCPGNCLSIQLGDNFMNMGLSQFSMKLKLAYEAKALFLHSSGTCTPEVDDMNLTAQISFAPPVKGRPQIKVSNIHLDVSTLHLNCDGFAGHFANALADVFKFFLSDLMDDILNLVVTHEVNEYLQNMTLSYDIDDYAMVNFDLVPSASSISNADLSIGVQGIVTPIANPNINFPFQPPKDLKSQCVGGGMVNIGLSLFSFQTFLYTYYIGGKLSANIPNVVTAKDVDLFIPGFKKQLGPDANLSLSIAATNFGTIQFIPAQNQLGLSMTMNFSLIGAQNTQYDMQVFADMAVDVHASGGKSSVLNIQIPTLTLSNPQVLFTNVGGELSGPLVITFLDSIMNSAVLKPINKYLAAHSFPLPSVSGFEAQDVKIIVNSDSLCVASNIAPVAGDY